MSREPDSASAAGSTGSSLAVSIVVHRSDLLVLERTLCTLNRAALAALSTEFLSRVELFVVDNSQDAAYAQGVRALLAKLAKTFHFTRWDYCPVDHNGGFGAGHNKILLLTACEFHLVLNPDVELEQSALTSAIALMRSHPDVVALNPHAVQVSGERQYLCKDYPSVLVLLLRAFAPHWVRRRAARLLAHYELRDRVREAEGPVDVPILSGCFLLLRSRAAHLAGGFDSRYFMYFEDFDLSRRLQRNGRLVYAPEVRITHGGGNAARKGWRHVFWLARSAVRFFNTHGWRWR